MKIRNKLLASASALAICLSSALGATTTNDWFAVDFGTGYTNGGLISNSTSGDGDWTSTGADASIMTNTTVLTKTGNMGKLDTQGGELTWTPSTASTEDVVLIDTDVYLVGSDEPPTTVTTDVQTEVYLKNILNESYEITGSVLCAHVYDTVGSSNAWVELEGFPVSHQSWVKLRIELNYKTAGTPMVSFWVDDILMEQAGAGAATAFRVMDASKTAVSSVSFMGTGYIDNFIGSQVEEQVAGTTFDPLVTTNGVPAFAGGTLDTTTTPGMLFATFDNTLGGEALQYVQLTGPDYVRTYRTSDGDEVEFDVSGLAAGTYSVTAYYGDAPSVVPGDYAPAAAASGGKPAAEVVEVEGSKVLRVNVNPVSGLYYTLFVGTDGAQPADLTAGAASKLAMPTDEDDETLTIDLPVPTTPNGVNLIKIYASDEAYDAEDSAPTETP